MKRAIVVCLMLAVALPGCSFFGSGANITEMIPGMSQEMDKLECWLTLVFERAPGDNATDVSVRFSSNALESGTESFDWDYIAENHVVSQGFMKGFSENTASSPGAPPPIKVPI